MEPITLDVDHPKSEEVKPCSIKMLPKELWAVAAQTAIQINPANAPSVRQLRMAIPGLEITHERLALVTAKRWNPGGVHLTVGFLDTASNELRAKILSHMNAWAQFCNVSFVEASINPDVRISFTPGDGYWSYLGTDIRHAEPNEPTMNLDSFSMTTPEQEFFRVVRHETGHTLGFPHEHMREEIVNGIDREKAIAYFMETQGWSRDEVIAQVLTPLNSSALIATAQADVNSIMCYWLPAEIMKDNQAVPGGLNIDPMDAQFAAQVYPLPHQASKSSPTLASFKNKLWDAFVANNNTNNLLICSSTDGIFWSDNTRINEAAQNGTSPSLAVFQDKLWLTFVANNNTNDVLICSSTDGITWTPNTKINQSAKSGSSPSLAVFDNKLWLAFVANNNSNDVLVCSSADGHTWTNNTRINQSAKSGSSPSLAVFGKNLWIAFVANNDSNDVLVCSSADGHTWTNNTRINQAAKSGSSPSLAVFGKNLWIAFVANNNSNDVLVCSSADGHAWTNNTRINQAAKTNTAPAITIFGARLWISFIANNNTNEVLICSSSDGVHWTNNNPI